MHISKEDLKIIHEKLRVEMNDQWKRVLPFNELFTDRWEKAKYLNFGKKTNVYDSSTIMGDVKVGSETWIGPYTLLDGTGGTLEIGNHCSISAGVQIYTHDTVRACVSGGIQEKECAPVLIEDNCYIAPMSIVSKGVSIGKCSVIAAHSLVNHCFPNNSIIAGVPAKKIGSIMIDENGEVRLEYDNGNT